MARNAVGSTDEKLLVDTALRLQKVVAEENVFAIVHAACKASIGAVGVDGWMVGRNGRSAHHVAHFGPQAAARPDDVEAWLLRRGAPPSLDRRVGGVTDVIWRRLADGPRIVGGLRLAGARFSAAERRRCTDFARLAAGAIAAFRQQRLSQMVLEALEQSEEAISFYDEADGVIFTNDAYHRIFTHYPSPAELVGRRHLDLYRMDLEAGAIDDPLARRDPEAYLAERARMTRTLVGRHREIQKIRSRTYIYTRTRSKTGATMSRRIDITEQASTEAKLRESERELQALAFRDPLTGLYNRAFLMGRLKELERRAAEGELAGLCAFLVDLDDFKTVNDTYGHDWGDHVLKTVANGLLRAAADTAGGVVVRLGGDEFLILIEKPIEDERLAAIGERIVADLSAPITRAGVAIRIDASIGIARRGGEGVDLASIVGDADLAMYEAKTTIGSGYRFFAPGLKAATVDRLHLIEDVRSALQRREFELHYQPQFSVATGRLVGFEALARWRRPDRGPTSPAVFIPILENHGLIEEFGKWTLEAACAEAARWPDDLVVAVNVSPLQVRDVRFPIELRETLIRSGLRPRRLELEVTESVFIDDERRTRAMLEDWKSLGCRVALDDFGHGYSSLGYLGAFPIDKLKIDQSFLSKFDATQPQATAGLILDAIIDLGRSLGMTVIAEGVEHPDQLEHLRRRGCPEAQGYLLGRPMPADQARRLVEATSKRGDRGYDSASPPAISSSRFSSSALSGGDGGGARRRAR
jgi:diguanylate cyclase (GGDEF)-like protein